MFEFRVLGPIEATRDGRLVDLGPLKQRAVLALLLMNPGRVVATDRLLDAVWAGEPGKENALWVTISRLRAALGGRRGAEDDQIVVTRDHGYVLEIDPLVVDVNRFESLVRDATTNSPSDPATVAELLGAALALWRGAPYEELRYEDFAQSEIGRLELLYEAANEEFCAARLALGVDAQLIADIDHLASERPLSERPVSLLMTALYRAGRQADALRAYSRFAQHLGDELGLEPSPELRRLEEQVLLHDMGKGSHPSHVGGTGTNPYRGLEVFREEDSGSFFGRDRLTATLLGRISVGHTLITLVGASGSGKSSIVRAGLIPALRKESLPSSDRWLIAKMVPGAHPFVELEAALLRSALDSPSSLGDQLADPEHGVLRAALRVLPDDDSRLVLIIDQLEELFTLRSDRDVVRNFLDGLVAAASDTRRRVIVVATLRSDFYTHALETPSFGTAMAEGVVNVVPLLPNELEEAAKRPAELAGATIEPSLLAQLLSDVLGRPGGLPLFQFVLTDLYATADDGVMTLDAYGEMGGLAGSLTNRAETLYESLTTEQKEAARQTFLRLVALTDDDERGRRRVTAAELLQLDIDSLDLQRVIDEFAKHRLLTLDRGPTTGEPTVEVAHEALLSEWTRLRGWIDDARQDLRRYAVLAVAAGEWVRSGRDADYLWKGRRLDDHIQWATTSTIQLTETDREFLDESTLAQAREQVQADELRRRDRRRRWGMAAALSTLGVVAVVLVAAWLGPEPPRVLLFEGAPPGDEIQLQLAAGLEQAERDFDIVTDRLFAMSDVEGELRQALVSEPDLVVLGLGVDGQVEGGARAIAADHPHTEFVVIDGLRTPDDPINLLHVTYATEQGSYLVGVVAALTSKTETVGFVGGVPLVIDPFRAGFEQGVQSVRPQATVLSTTSLADFSKIWVAAGFAADAAERLVGDGADVIYHAIGPAGRGVFETARNSTSALRTVWAIGVDTDEARTADPAVQEFILTSMIKRHDLGVYVAIENFLAGLHQDVRLDIASGGIDYVDDRLAPEVIAAVEAARVAIIAGTVTVRRSPPEPITAPPPPDHVVDVVADDDGCVATPEHLDVEVHDVVQVDVDNQSTGLILAGVTGPDSLVATIDALESGDRSTLSAVAPFPGLWSVRCGSPLDHIPVIAIDVRTPEPTTSVAVTFNGTSCVVETDAAPVVGDAALVTFRNTSEDLAFVGVFRLPPGYTEDDGPVITNARSELAEAELVPGGETTGLAVFKLSAPWAASCFSVATGSAVDSQVFVTSA